MLQASPKSEASPLTLLDIALDLQIIICTLLHPPDILALRETCKTLQLVTRQRGVWVAALRRVCLDNSLFLPSFPILDMSDAELEHAAMGPYRWIELCAAFEKQPNDSDATLCPRTTRSFEHSLATGGHSEIFIVPGGRYIVRYSSTEIAICDLGYTSSADCKLIASVIPEDESFDCMFQATPDGMGLIIFSHSPYGHCSVYEIYPQSETPQLTRIAHLGPHPSREYETFLFPDRVVWYVPKDGLIFRVWDYRTNYSIGFSAYIDVNQIAFSHKVIATKTAIIFIGLEEILVWAIPPLSPQLPNFFDPNPPRIPPLFAIPYPDYFKDRHFEFFTLQTMSHWYDGSSQPLYFDILCLGSKLQRFEIIGKPDLLNSSLHLINTEHVPHEFFNDINFRTYSICEDTLVAYWDRENSGQCGVYTGLTSPRFTNVISHGGPAAKMLFPPTVWKYEISLCPASGRYVHIGDGIISIFDLF